MRTKLNLELGTSLADLKRGLEKARRFLDGHGVKGDRRYAVDLALDELLSNIVRHAATATRMTLDVAMLKDSVRVRISDDGAPFDPATAPKPDLDAPLTERKIGGLGLHLVRELAGEISYERANGRNRIEVTVPRS